ncbi:MAG: sulfite exporter TauE/SafE family protein [Chloroflexi bacterium]|nr:sulfite exporter TauE/SafE family protein [Chloroflexota bacterium]
MFDLWIAFITGLTAGGLSCMAIQGGLLTSSLASQLEKDVHHRPQKKIGGAQLATPIVIFLLAKLAAYTLLGVLLGALGSTIALTAPMRALLQFAIGIFMIGNALRMFNVHPLFRYFTFETPSFITRFIRKSAKGETVLATPILLGVMTVLIPCGITQSMMAIALGTASPLAGAALMFAFTLGASPVFFALAYFTARLGAAMEKYFMRLVALTLLILGVYAIETGLNLWGAPFSLTNTLQSLSEAAHSASVEMASTNPLASGADVILYARNYGYDPKTLNATADMPIKLLIVTQNTTSCALAFTIPDLSVAKDLPVTGSTIFDIPAQPKGTVMRFSCSMGMYTGKIVFE